MMKNVCLNECMKKGLKKLGKIEVSASSGFLQRLGVSELTHACVNTVRGLTHAVICTCVT